MTTKWVFCYDDKGRTEEGETTVIRETTWQSDVRWAECDAAGIIYHARVLDWFSEGRIAWLKAHGLDYYEVLRTQGIELLVKSANVSFHHTLRPGDPIDLITDVDLLTPTRVSFRYRIRAPQDTSLWAVEGQTEHAFVMNGRARRLNRVAPALFTLFEQSQ